MDKFSEVALSTFFRIMTHGYGFYCTFTKIFLGICGVYSISMKKNYRVYSLTRYSLEMFLWVTNNVKFVNSAEECPSTSGVALQLRDANTTIYFWSVENYKDFTPCPGSTVASTSSPKQCLKSLEFSKQLSDVITQIKWDISCKLDVNFRLLDIWLSCVLSSY